MWNLTIQETMKMSKNRITLHLGRRAKHLESLGMSHEEACEFISGIMNLGISASSQQTKK